MSRRAAAKEGSSSAYTSFQQKRRAQALDRQKNAREDKVQQLRTLALAAIQDDAEAMHEDTQQQPQNRQQQRHRRRGQQQQQQQELPQDTQLYGMDGVNPLQLGGSMMKAYFARQLMQPEWMSDIPQDLGSSWLVMPRPEGKRCLVISTGNYTYARSRTGALLLRFPSKLPGGGPGTSGGESCYCVLDCILQEQEQRIQHQHNQQQQQQRVGMDADMAPAGESTPSQPQQHSANGSSSSSSSGGCTFFIQDVLAWRGYSLVDCGAEFRLFWLASKLQEEAGGSSSSSSWSLDGGNPGPSHSHRFKLLPYWHATPDGLAAAARAGAAAAAAAAAAAGGCPGYVQDGVYLRHVEGHYSQGGGCTPLALLWKDAGCSRYLLDTDGDGVVPEFQQLVLAYQGPPTDGVATADEPPVVLGRLPQEFVQQMGPKLLRPGRLLRFSIRAGGLLFNADGSPAGADLAYEGPANQRRGRADVYTKVLFQWQARRQPLQLEALLAAAVAEQQQQGAGQQQGSSMADD
ncbi:hypothetical protein OEZ85_009178 [Tetradesmus obliquus]|uniref:Snurportin-1 n=1 Tax=Tetradesmus obliquus TaxID=3088 RepID=A0ABY8TN44_TETOB|nr:hypothetical protein OEZ85_009178 [Tetradesmus obliquus]